MSPAQTEKMSRRAMLAVWACRATAIAIPFALLISWGFGEAERNALLQLGLPLSHAISTSQRAVAILLSILPVLAVAMSLFRLATCFDGFAKAEWFGAEQPQALASAGRWLMSAGALSLLVPTLLSLALSFNATPGERVMAITLSSTGILAILFGLAFWSLGHLWTQARAIATENAEFV